MKSKIICFGLGKIYRTFLSLYDEAKAEIIALSDNNPAKWNSGNVVEPSKINDLEFDFIVITSAYYKEIERQLCEYGIEPGRILNFYHIYTDLAVNGGVDYSILDILKKGIPMTGGYGKIVGELIDSQEKALFLNAKIFSNAVRNQKIESLKEVEFQVYSQFGEDGIIQWLIHNVVIENKTFVEFGVEDYMEANTRFLLMNDNWTGLVMDGSEENMDRLRNWKWFWKYDLRAVDAFITKDNINQLIMDAGFQGDIGILSIDLDGNDWWILNAIQCVSPRILICEYNNIFGADKQVTVPYDAAFVRNRKHYSCLYWGCSIAAFCGWAEKNGYYYMGSNSAGNNAFFVRKDCMEAERVPKNANVFIESKYRESRNQAGQLTFLRGSDRLECIKSMELLDLETGCIDMIENIYDL